MMQILQEQNIEVRGIGMVASLGLDVSTCCASARAGLTKITPQENYPVTSLDDFDMQDLLTHEVPFVTNGYEGSARISRLIEASLLDLLQSVSEPLEEPISNEFYLAIPDPARLEAGENLRDTDTNEEQLQSVSKPKELAPEQFYDWEMLLKRAAANANWPGPVNLRFISISGHTGTAEAVAAAVQDLSQLKVNRAIVVCADSLLDASTITWLNTCGRLKQPAQAVGVVPGEAGVSLLIEKNDTGHKHLSQSLATMKAVAIDQDSRPLLLGAQSDGRILANLVAKISEIANWREGAHSWIISDQNGEYYRANEWGGLLFHLGSQQTNIVQSVLWMPAASFGDTGAASGAVAIAIACQAFARQYHPSSDVIVVSTSESSIRSIILLRKSKDAVIEGKR